MDPRAMIIFAFLVIFRIHQLNILRERENESQLDTYWCYMFQLRSSSIIEWQVSFIYKLHQLFHYLH